MKSRYGEQYYKAKISSRQQMKQQRFQQKMTIAVNHVTIADESASTHQVKGVQLTGSNAGIADDGTISR